MPIYTYQCGNCGVRFDKDQSFDEPNPLRCPECRKNELHRVYRPVGVIFKGSGFYATDNRSSTRSTSSVSDAKEKDKKTTEAAKPEPAKKESSPASKD